MSNPILRQCPYSNCAFNKKMVHADYQQIKKHLWSHSYKDLLRISRGLNLIQEYVKPIKFELVDMLAGFSKVRSNSND